ncbi:MAG: serine hydrolase, partial [Oscillospiraceae bacterium]
MKKTVALICCFLMFSLPFSFVFVRAEKDNFALPPQTASQCYIVTDATTGQVYIQKNAEEKKFPASITKLLTVALVLEKGNLDDVITVSKTAVSLPSEATRANFYEGEEITVRDAVYAAILVSGNDAANALAEYIAGTNENFDELMNEKAAQCGCTNTHFSNPS